MLTADEAKKLNEVVRIAFACPSFSWPIGQKTRDEADLYRIIARESVPLEVADKQRVETESPRQQLSKVSNDLYTSALSNAVAVINEILNKYPEPQPINANLMKRMVAVLWKKVVKTKNPWFDGAISDPKEYKARWELRNQIHLRLSRELYNVVFDKEQITETLLKDVLEFLEF